MVKHAYVVMPQVPFHYVSGVHMISSRLLTSNSCRYEYRPNSRRQVSERTRCPLHSRAICKSSRAYTKREQGICTNGKVIICLMSSLPLYNAKVTLLIVSRAVLYIMSVMGYGMLLVSRKPHSLSFRYATSLAWF